MRVGSIVYLKSESTAKKMTVVELVTGNKVRVTWQDKSMLVRFAVIPEKALTVIVY